MTGGASSVKAGHAFVEITMDDTKLVKGLRSAQKQVKTFGEGLTGLGTKMTMIGAAVAAPFVYVTKQFADFDDQMRLVQGVTGATDTAMGKLTDTAKRLGRETSYTAAQVAQGMVSLGRMGFTVDEINNSIGNFMTLDRATGMNDLGQSAEIAAAAMRSFGMSAQDTGRIADVLTATANGSAQTLTDVGEALKMAATNANMSNHTIEDTSAMLGVLANLGIKGRLAGPALAKSFDRLAPGDGAQILQGNGIKTLDAQKNLRPMRDILIDIAKVTKGMGTGEKIAFFKDVFDIHGVKGGGLLAGQTEQLDKFLAALENSEGVAAKIAAKMDSGIGGAFRIFWSAVEGVGNEIGEIIGNYLKPYMETVSKVLNRVAEWVKEHKDLIVTIVKVTAGVLAVGAALIALGAAVKVIAFSIGGLIILIKAISAPIFIAIAAVKALMAAFVLLKTVIIGVKVVALATLAAISTPAVLVAVALGVLVAAVWKLTGAWDMCADGVRGLAADFGTAFKAIGEVVGQTWEAIKIALSSDDLAGAAKVGLSALKVVWLTGLFPLKKAWFELKNFLDDAWTVTVYSILKQANNLWYGLLIGLKSIGNGIANAWDAIWGGIIGAFESTIAYLKKKWIQFKGFFDSDVNIDAEIAKVDAEIAANKSERAKRSNDAVNRRTGEVNALESERDQFGNAIDQSMYDKMNKHQQSYSQAMSDAAKSLADAKTQWQTAIDDVKRKAAAGEVKTPEATQADVAKKISGVTADAAINADKVTGAWQLADLAGALNNTAADRTAAATEKSAMLQEKANRKLDNIAKNSVLSYT